MQFAKEDRPVQLGDKEEDLSIRYHEILKATVDVLSLLFKEDYYLDILDAEKTALSTLANNQDSKNKSLAKQGFLSKFYKMFK